MQKVYIIEVDESDAHEAYVRTLKKAFTSYESAKEFLLKDFNCKVTDNCEDEWFELKDDYECNGEYQYGAIAGIAELDLV